MSRNVFHFVNVFFNRYKDLNNNNFLYIPFIGTPTCGHLAFVVSSEKTKNVLITNKYTFTQSGHTNFMVVDNKGNHYNMTKGIPEQDHELFIINNSEDLNIELPQILTQLALRQ